ncbi:MAG: hypothetical protein IPO81_04660 [Kouleothrix sp.]|nr:hypothetical protein [Kouleothrix sp.]
MPTAEPNAQGGAQPPAEAAQQPAPAIDMQQLAERVYRLMLEDLRLERARGERAPRPKTR